MYFVTVRQPFLVLYTISFQMFEHCLSARSKDTLCQPCVVILSKHYHVTCMISWTNKRIEVSSVCDPCITLSSCIILRLFGTFCGHSLTAVLLLPLLVPLGVKLEEAGSKVNGWSWCTVAENPLTKGYLYKYPQRGWFQLWLLFKNPGGKPSWYEWSLSQLLRQKVVIFKRIGL